MDMDRFIDDMKTARAESGGARAVREALAAVVSDSADVMRGLGEPKEAGLHRVYHSPDLTILNVVWAPYMTLMPHNHGGVWAVIGVYTGREDNIFWCRRKDDPAQIEAVGADAMMEGDSKPLGKDVIHSVTNPIPRLTGAIHVYGGDFFAGGRSEWDPEALTEKPYDADKANDHFQDMNRRFAS